MRAALLTQPDKVGEILTSLIGSFTIPSRPDLKDGAASEMIARAAVCNPSMFWPGPRDVILETPSGSDWS